MPVIHFICRQCDNLFCCEVGHITFPKPKFGLFARLRKQDSRPQFERDIVCPNCGVRTIDSIELPEIGQSELTKVWASERFGSDTPLFNDEGEYVLEENESAIAEETVNQSQKINLGRNDPCHCGSGRKYKKCYLENDEGERRKGFSFASFLKYGEIDDRTVEI